ncbi:MAG TPA: hypothetical protein VGL99_34055 [Chloroflexota bacterium]|jgi:hypothetical protein
MQQDPADNPARRAVFDELERAALDTYGEERTAEIAVQTILGRAATALWRISQESLEPMGPEPLPTHG